MNTTTTDTFSAPAPATYRVLIPSSLRELDVPAAGLRWFHDVGPTMRPSGLRKVRLQGDTPYLMPQYQPSIRSAFAIRVVVLEDVEGGAEHEEVPVDGRNRISFAPLSTSAKTASRKVRIETLLARDGDTCWYCGLPLGDDISIEHLVARSLGGPEVAANEVLAHSRCNSLGGDLSVVQKLVIREALRSLSNPAAVFAPAAELRVDGQLTDRHKRWCATCQREHGASFVCASYSEEVKREVRGYMPPPLLAGEHGDGISSLLSGFAAGGAR